MQITQYLEGLTTFCLATFLVGLAVGQHEVAIRGFFKNKDFSWFFFIIFLILVLGSLY